MATAQLYVTLNTGARMPSLAFGTVLETIDPNQDQDYAARVVKDALDVGYRHIDAALIYGNEVGVGRGLQAAFRSGKLSRDDVFITTKLWRNSMSREAVVPALRRQLRDLQLDHVDLYLVHWPTPFPTGEEVFPKDSDGNQLFATIDHLDTWKGMEECFDLGLTKAIGLSNYNSQQIQRVLDNCKVKPACLQIESHVYMANERLIRYCEERGVRCTSYSPLGGANPANQTVFRDAVVKEIAARHNATVAQIAVQFQLQRNLCVAVRSSKRHRMEENFKALDVKLSEDDMKTLFSLNKNMRVSDEFPEHPQYPLNIEF